MFIATTAAATTVQYGIASTYVAAAGVPFTDMD